MQVFNSQSVVWWIGRLTNDYTYLPAVNHQSEFSSFSDTYVNVLGLRWPQMLRPPTSTLKCQPLLMKALTSPLASAWEHSMGNHPQIKINKLVIPSFFFFNSHVSLQSRTGAWYWTESVTWICSDVNYNALGNHLFYSYFYFTIYKLDKK